MWADEFSRQTAIRKEGEVGSQLGLRQARNRRGAGWRFPKGPRPFAILRGPHYIDENDLFDGEKILRFETLLELGQVMRELGVRAFEMGKGDFDRMNRSDRVHQIVSLVDYDYLGRGEGDLGMHTGARGIRKERRSEESIRVSLFTCKL